MAKNFSNVMDYKVVANNGFQFNVKVNGVNNLGNRKWMLRAVEVIRDYFTFTEGADEGLIVNVVVNTHEIIVKAEFNGKKYFTLPIQPRYGKNQIKDILDNMGVIKDVIDVYTNNMVKEDMKMKKNFTCNDAVMQIDTLIDFVKNEGEGMSIKDVKNIIESVDRIYENVQKSDDVDSKTKDNFWYWDKELNGINDIVYKLESSLFNIKDALEE